MRPVVFTMLVMKGCQSLLKHNETCCFYYASNERLSISVITLALVKVMLKDLSLGQFYKQLPFYF